MPMVTSQTVKGLYIGTIEIKKNKKFRFKTIFLRKGMTQNDRK